MRRRHLPVALRLVFLACTGAFMLAPFVVMVAMSLKSPADMFAGGGLLPSGPHWDNYAQAVTRAPLLRFMANSAAVCIGVFALQLIVSLPCAYAISKLRFAGRRPIFVLVLAGLLIPQQVLAVPLFVAFHALGLLDTYLGLILPTVITPFGIFLMRQFFRTVPDELIHAARLDGMSEIGILVRIMAPVALPAIAAFAIFSLTYHWNELFWPLIVVSSEEIATAPIGLTYFRAAETGDAYGPLLAGTVIVTAPLVLLFLFAQRHVVRGLTLGGK